MITKESQKVKEILVYLETDAGSTANDEDINTKNLASFAFS
jgi:hypothetical protein